MFGDAFGDVVVASDFSFKVVIDGAMPFVEDPPHGFLGFVRGFSGKAFHVAVRRVVAFKEPLQFEHAFEVQVFAAFALFAPDPFAFCPILEVEMDIKIQHIVQVAEVVI